MLVACRRKIGHKVAITVCTTIALGTAIFVYYWFAAMVEDKGLLGVMPAVDGYLRWSAVAFFIAALLTYAMTFIPVNPTRIVLIVVSALVILNLTTTLVTYFGLPGFVVRKYRRLFDMTKYLTLAEAYEKSEHCCGWAAAPGLVHTPDCPWNVTCDVAMKAGMGGINIAVMAAGVGGPLALMIYTLIAHVLVIHNGDYVQLGNANTV